MSTAKTPEMSMTNMPGFTAEASLYSSKRRFLTRSAAGSSGAANIIPARRIGSGLCCERCGWGDDWCCEPCLM